MPSPPDINMNPGDFRDYVTTIASIALLIPLCFEAKFAANEKFIGVNVSEINITKSK